MWVLQATQQVVGSGATTEEQSRWVLCAAQQSLRQRLSPTSKSALPILGSEPLYLYSKCLWCRGDFKETLVVHDTPFQRSPGFKNTVRGKSVLFVRAGHIIYKCKCTLAPSLPAQEDYEYADGCRNLSCHIQPFLCCGCLESMHKV